MEEAIVGINAAGEVRALFYIFMAEDEHDAAEMAAQWLRDGRTVKRCSAAHARKVIGKLWQEPNARLDRSETAGRKDCHEG